MAERRVVRSLPALRERAARLAAGPGRRVLGITGPPGAGKSTLASWLESEVNGTVPADRPIAAQVPMDGFHLPNAVLAERGLTDRKGAPETFDVAAYGALLRRVRDEPGRAHTAPSYSRVVHEPVPDSHLIPPSARLVIAEGNYLLGGSPAWDGITPLFDEIWYAAVPFDVIRARLIERQLAGGRPLAEAVDWVDRSDLANARFVDAVRARADLLVELPPDAF